MVRLRKRNHPIYSIIIAIFKTIVVWSILFFISFQIWIRHIRKKAIFDNIKTIPYHLLISTKKVSCTTAKDFFNPTIYIPHIGQW